ncbi:hypothetical protein OBBRIDRAFT_133210 [Obba rivulosa]|uniref:Uncharacterized protein n=1 Tax=Obba rivulosa TaxID=1052685 RepID=A0A8E2ASZ6_9APHY|nr:hypothetical protein OBBRIDRAFT_133210 [Obba rivulosa]
MMQDDKRYWSYNSIDSIPPAQVSPQLSQCLYLIHAQQPARTYSDEVLKQRSPYGPNPNFFLSIGRYCYWKEGFRHTSISWDQLSQFLMFEGSEYTAECAIASSLDGIPSTLVRKYVSFCFPLILTMVQFVDLNSP